MLRSLRTLAAGQDRAVLGVLLLSALCLTGLAYFDNPIVAAQTLRQLGLDGAADALTARFAAGEHADLLRRLYWALVSDFFYLVPPLLAIALCGRRPAASYGLRLRVEAGFWRLFAAGALLMLPLVLLMSATPAFQSYYPFYRPSLEPGWLARWLVFEAAYLSQFFAVEFFFRGFMLHGLRPALGVQAVAVMMVPYCMLHFGKPLPETLGSILAGLGLGLLSYRSRSILLGVLLHVTVAATMDTAVLWQRGYFGAGVF